MGLLTSKRNFNTHYPKNDYVLYFHHLFKIYIETDVLELHTYFWPYQYI